MKSSLIVCFLLGSLVVLQPSLNRMICETKGLSFAVLLNGAVLFTLGFLLFLVAKLTGGTLALSNSAKFNWWYVLPGLMGFLLVTCVPILIKNLGAFITIVTMILGQLIISLLWDSFREGIPFNPSRFAGLILVVTGAYFSYRTTV